MAQRNWGKANQALKKIVRKDSLNVEARILQSKWFFDSYNPQHQLDSAYFYSLKALQGFQKLSSKQKEKLARYKIDSAFLIKWRNKIDSAAFIRAKLTNTEKSYNDFLSEFTFAKTRSEAVELRDESAYLDALRQNTYPSFQKYFTQYPKSHRAAEAHQRYEKLLFEVKTNDGKLGSYLSFVKDFPKSPYKTVADKTIFEMLTVSGISSDFEKFILEHPDNSFANEARSILFHLTKETEEKFPETLLTDSLKKVNEINKPLWAPVYKNGKYGFINSQGIETIPPQFEEIEELYKCGSIANDILLTGSGAISRIGKLISAKTNIRDVGYGFLKAGDSTCAQLIHKSGITVLNDCLQDASILAGKFLLIKKNNVFGVYALNGRMLLPPQYQSIETMAGIVVLDLHGKKMLCSADQIARLVDGQPLPEALIFDEVKVIGVDRLIVRNGPLEGIINSNLEFIVPLAMQSLIPSPMGVVRKYNDQYVFADVPALAHKPWSRYSFHGQWLRLSDVSGDQLFDIHEKKIIEPAPDSLWFENRLAFATTTDSVRIYANSSSRITVTRNAKINFIASVDSILFFYTEQKNKKTIFSIESGKKMFVTEADKIVSLNAQFFIVTHKNKKGLVGKTGKIILKTEYDEFVLSGNLLSVYKDKKFGLYDTDSKKMVKPIFEKNLRPIYDSLLIAYKDGHYGLINWQAKNIIGFEFDDIQPWNNTALWVKKGFEWILVDFRANRKLLSHIKNYSLLKNTIEEKIALVKQDNFFGVVSSIHGIIIPPSFTEINNLGSESEPLYFTSKEVEEAGIVVVIYYDRNGKLLRKQVYEEEEYAKIACTTD
ncbi:MAG: WG repeat-containing protein [Bacteroidetes bacterium]|nr:WG repeat-containing protein [Bacteroidota bacterium]